MTSNEQAKIYKLRAKGYSYAEIDAEPGITKELINEKYTKVLLNEK